MPDEFANFSESGDASNVLTNEGADRLWLGFPQDDCFEFLNFFLLKLPVFFLLKLPVGIWLRCSSFRGADRGTKWWCLPGLDLLRSFG